MKNIFFPLIAILAVGCGGHKKKGGEGPDPKPSLPWAQGAYSCVVEETENTCAEDGPREFPDPIPVTFKQADAGTDEDGDVVPTDEVYFDGGGIYFGGPGTLTTANAFAVTDFAVGDVMTLDYASVFDVEDGVATGNVGSMRIDYVPGACYDENVAGYNTLELDCEKTGDIPPGSEGQSAASVSPVRLFDARPKR